MFKWKKKGRVFDPTEITNVSWLKEFAQAPSVLIFENYVRVFFSCRPPANFEGQYVSYSAFLDLNRTNLFEVLRLSKEPIFKLGEKGDFDEFGTYPTSVIQNENTNKNEVLAYYAGWTRCESVPFNVAIGMARSFDGGETFNKMGRGPIIPYSPNEPFVMSGPKIRRFNNQWYLFYIAGKKWKVHNNRCEPVYQIRMATSQDAVTWTKIDKNIIETRLEEDECQASPDVFFSNGKYHMFFCYRYSTDYRGKEKGYRIGYASSIDLIHWVRNDSLSGIDISEEGWDSEMISYPHVFELDGKIYMLYLGNEVGRYGFGLAELEGSL